MNVTTIRIDLAKHSFSLHGVDSRGKTMFRKTLARAKLKFSCLCASVQRQ
jgi:hypothetical protein